jgi:ribosome biogenesis GTPase
MGGLWRRASEVPVVGDWVAEEGGIPLQLLPRRTWLRRGEGEVLAANLDVAFVVSGLGADVNTRRLERYLVLALDGGVEPVFVLNKCDLGPAAAEVGLLREVARDHQVLVTSATTGTGLEALRDRLRPRRTGVLLGSSGVGKSSLLNALLGAALQDVAPLRARDGRGVHTTTARSLFPVAGGGLLIDTPGLREVTLPPSEAAVEEAFPDIEALARGCRFRDCRHLSEPGCAVAAAEAQGRLGAGRTSSYRKLLRETERASEDALARSRRRARIKALHRAVRAGRDRP